MESLGFFWNGAQVYGQMTVTDPSGETFRGDGFAMALLGYTAEGGAGFYSSVTGAFQWTAAPPTSWLHEGDSAGLTVLVVAFPSYRRMVQLQGSVQVEEESGLFAVAFAPESGTLLETDGLGAECAKEPGGTLSVRDPNGIWYDVAFDGPTADGKSLGDASRCDGCGDVTVEGEVIGSVCPDFSTWMSWESSPW
jgi:hypothetical protein